MSMIVVNYIVIQINCQGYGPINNTMKMTGRSKKNDTTVMAISRRADDMMTMIR